MVYGTGKHRYELIEGWAKCPDGWSFKDVCGISIDAMDRVYILSRSDRPVTVFDREGNFLTSWGEGLFKRAHGSCIGSDGSVYCTDDGNHTVTKFGPDGKVLLTLGNKDQPSDSGYVHKANMEESLATIKKGSPPFNRPTGVALSCSGEIYVSDGYGNARIHKFTSDGILLFSWGEPGRGPGQFRIPHAVFVDRWERVWVADRENDRIQIFNDHGEFQSQWSGLNLPTGIFIDNDDIVYISELKRRVSIFTIDGKLLARWGNEPQNKETDLFIAPHAIAVDSFGDIYVGEVSLNIGKIDRGSRTIQKFAKIS